MNLIDYAESELERIPKDKDGMQEIINQNILDLVKLFSSQGHSGLSGRYVINALSRLLEYKPLNPLTGEADEWGDPYGPDETQQNKRRPSVFRSKTDPPHDIDAIVVSDNGGESWFYSHLFKKEINFPYLPPVTPEKIYIEYVKEKGICEVITDDVERIARLREKTLKKESEL